MRKLLLAYDGTPGAEAALEDLTHAGLPEVVEATVLAVADVWVPPEAPAEAAVSADPFAGPMQQARLRALEVIEAARVEAERGCARLRQLFTKWIVTPCACGDSPAWAVVRKATEKKTDLIATGTHGRPALERFFLGSVGHRIAAEAPCSVRIGRARRAGEHRGLTNLVAVDGSGDSELAIMEVAGRSWPATATFQLVTVVDPRLQTAAAWPSVQPDRWVAEHFKDAGDWISTMTREMAGRLRRVGLNVETHIFDGDPKHVLLKQAEEFGADCVFLGARGLHHGGRLHLGTIASALASRAPCSVEIVRSRG